MNPPVVNEQVAMIRIASINQDRGIAPGRSKGAAVHLSAMRDAFHRLGCVVEPVDEPDGKALRKQLECLHDERPLDMIYERYALGADCGARFASQHGVPLVLEVNAPLADEAMRYRGHRESPKERERDRFLFSQSSLVLPVSDAVASYARDRGADAARILVCPNGIDERRFHPGVRMAAGRLPGISPETLVLGFHGRERPWHRFDKLLACFESLLERGMPLHLLVVGEGDFIGLDDLPPGSHTRLGWQPHEMMAQWVARFDILPLTHQPDVPFYFSPLKLAEAMACGVVPVVPDLGDLAERIGQGSAGIVYPAGNMDRLESAIEFLATHPEQRALLAGHAARRAAGQSWTVIATKVLDRLLPDRLNAA